MPWAFCAELSEISACRELRWGRRDCAVQAVVAVEAQGAPDQGTKPTNSRSKTYQNQIQSRVIYSNDLYCEELICWSLQLVQVSACGAYIGNAFCADGNVSAWPASLSCQSSRYLVFPECKTVGIASNLCYSLVCCLSNRPPLHGKPVRSTQT